ncbi:Monoacylglycerol lipase ABHD12 [Armadillidium nasatum]|uniref:Monoacylglycerol lipase ABHD12 n=1 Tax=Armadillidium nasatum TaxID=96803 RepID=A0A5N5TH96_9CRUS|nr:Monoacylglycerol lipase ABHD12 [Armadillidium nasatum]
MITYFKLNRRRTFRSSSSVQNHFVFQNDGGQERPMDFSYMEKFELFGAYNRYIHSEVDVLLGVWQILPHDLISEIPVDDESKKGTWFLQQLGDDRPIVLYCHGNKPSRATPHRVMLYKVLQNMNFHVITFDYRGFADSTDVEPSENGVVQDTIAMINWIRAHSKSSPLYIWGHSLGTGIASKATRILCESNLCPDALILQSPFTSIKDELHSSRKTLPFRIFPWFDAMFVQPLNEHGLTFDTKENILYVTCPLLILHAEDDAVVPYSLGKKLFQIVFESRNSDSKSVKFVTFDKKFKYGHNYICRAPELPIIVREFLRESVAKNL